MNRYIVLILLTVFLASCANTKTENNAYIVSADRNDIKDKDPELWSWIETQSKNVRSKEKQAKAIYPKQLEYVKSLTNDLNQIEKRQPFIGVWVDCDGDGLGRVYKFFPNGEFHSFEKSFSSLDCLGSANPGLAGFGFEFKGYYLVGKILQTGEAGNLHELDLVHTDSERTNNYDESKTYYKVAFVNGSELRFSSRGNPSVLLPPTKRNLKLDDAQYTYIKCDCVLNVE